MSRVLGVFFGLAVVFVSPHALSVEAPKPIVSIGSGAGFPNLPHASRWIGTTERATPGKGGKTPLRYNPPCTEPDQPCNGDPWNGDPRDAFNNGGWTEVLDTQVGGVTSSLERVTVYGKSNGDSWPNAVCISSECRIYDLPLVEVAKQSPEPVSEVIFEFLTQVITVLDKCVKTPPSNPVKTPDQDKDRGYFLAMDSITQTYAGNVRMLRPGMRVDVQYPIGQTVRYLITSTSTDRGFKEVTGLVRFIDGVPDADNTPCK